MKICNSEAMKLIKELEAQRISAEKIERTRSCVQYKEGEKKNPSDYDYAQSRERFKELDGKIRKIKCALSRANCSVIVPEFSLTIGECLVLLAQLNAEYGRINDLASREKLSRRITLNGIIEYTEQLYDPSEAEKDAGGLLATIGKLQVAIDRANLNNFIDIEF